MVHTKHGHIPDATEAGAGSCMLSNLIVQLPAYPILIVLIKLKGSLEFHIHLTLFLI